jgi:hypothetical protein
MPDHSSKSEPDQPVTKKSRDRLTQEMREILDRNAGNEARARKELSALLTKYKRGDQT